MSMSSWLVALTLLLTNIYLEANSSVRRRCILSYYYPAQVEWYESPAYYVPMGYYGLGDSDEKYLDEEELQIQDEDEILEFLIL